jgi:uncharacterized protein YggE
LALAAPLMAQSATKGPHIKVSGEGVVKAVPDILTLHLSVEKAGPNVEAAKQAVDKRTADAIDVARKVGVAKRDITSTQIYISPQYHYDHDERKLVGYRVRRNLTMTLRAINHYPPLLKGLVNAGVNGISGVSAGYSKPEKLREKAFGHAVNDARDKAERLARGFKARLGAVYAIVEQSAPTPHPVMMRQAVKANAKSSAFEPGTVKIKARIQVVFRLRPHSVPRQAESPDNG